LLRLFRVAQRFNVEIQPQLILLHKTLFNIEGLGRQLYPELDLWKTAHPIMKRWMQDRVGPRAMLADLRENLPHIREALRELPGAIHTLAEQAVHGEVRVSVDAEEIAHLYAELVRARRQRLWLTIAATVAIVSSIALAILSLG
jgi:ubiquinone biosynthesis protein